MDKYQVRSCLSASGSITYDPLTGVIGGGGGGGATWGSITGTLSSQTDLQTALDAKQNESIVINSNTTAVLDGVYTVVASATFTDPTPAEGKGFMVFVRNGTATVGGTGYSTAGTVINRIYHSGAWANYTSSSFTPSALTKTDDTNVTLTLGGTPSTALLQAASLTLGWSGQLAIARGGTGLGTLGTALQQLRVNAGGTALEYFTPSAGSGLTIGTTAITSGTVGRVLFEGAGNVLQENAILNLDTTNGLIIGGSTARGTRLTLVNAADTLASKTLVIRNAADSSETFSFTGNGIFNIGVANSNSDVITLAGSSWFRATSSPSALQFQSIGFGNTITNVNLYSSIIGHANTLNGASSERNFVNGQFNIIGASVVDSVIAGSYFNLTSATRVTCLGRRSNAQRGVSGTDLTWIGYSLENNNVTLNTNIVTYFNNQNMSHAIRKGGNIALLGEKYQILQDSTGTVSQRLSTYMELAATNTITIHNGTAPTGNITDAIQAYAADITAGNTALFIRNENGDIIKLYKETVAVAAAALVSNLGVPLTSTDTIGGYTLLQVVKALQLQGLLA